MTKCYVVYGIESCGEDAYVSGVYLNKETAYIEMLRDMYADDYAEEEDRLSDAYCDLACDYAGGTT